MRPGSRAIHLALALLSRDWAGLLVALLPAVAGAWCVTLGRLSVVGAVLLVVAAVLCAGSVRHLVHVGRIGRRYPPPGRMVDVGGHRMHVLAEGDRAAGSTVVWMPGGHVGGYAMLHLHVLMRQQARSVLVDRPGTGWSDPGTFPRTTATEAVELLAALERSGEKPPFVLVGHSFGGLLVANAARRRPDLVAGLVLLDPTPPDVITFGPPVPALRHAAYGQLWKAVRHLFGLHGRRRTHATAPRREEGPTGTDGAVGVLDAVESRTRAACAAASIFRELSPQGMARVGWQTVLHDGDLGSLPVMVVVPGDLTEGEEALTAAGDRDEAVRLRRFYTTARGRYLTTSSRAWRVLSPEGTGHNFPDEVPAFVVDVVRSMAGGHHTRPPSAR
ncbi:alpha/beta hydrolase [Streptomyces sannanensis]